MAFHRLDDALGKLVKEMQTLVLDDVVEGARPQHAGGEFFVSLACDHENGDEYAFPVQPLQEVAPLHVFQELIQDHQIEGFMSQDDEGVRARPTALDLVAGTLQTPAHQQGVLVVILDQEQPQCFVHHTGPRKAVGTRNVIVTAVPWPRAERTRIAPPLAARR
jgi:hypothetical protein